MADGKLSSIDVKCFFSCSFDEADRSVNNLIKAICSGLDIKTVNVSTGASTLPPDKAMALIEESEGLIAVCLKREELKAGSFNMPQAVNDEIAFAYGKEVPILALIEKGVNKGGFSQKFRTYHEFERSKMSDPSEIEKFVRAIHEFKVGILCDDHVPQIHDPSDSYADELRHLVELKYDDGEFSWEYSTSKKIVFQRHSARSFPVSVFATSTMQVPDGAAPIEWKFEQLRASREIKLVPTIDEQTPTRLEARLRPEPAAEKGDSIEYVTTSRSKYLIPLWKDEVADERSVHLQSGEYRVYEGLLFIHRAKKAKIEFRIPREYKIKLQDLAPFVASYTTGVDYEVPAELERIDIRKEDFGGNLVIALTIESALPNHIYGIAWNPPERPPGASKNDEVEA